MTLFTYVSARQTTPLQIQVIYFGNKKIYCFFKTSCIISVLFSTKWHLIYKCSFFCSNNTFFINHAIKFKCQPGHLEVNASYGFPQSLSTSTGNLLLHKGHNENKPCMGHKLKASGLRENIISTKQLND
jgi:hypothetical protein